MTKQIIESWSFGKQDHCFTYEADSPCLNDGKDLTQVMRSFRLKLSAFTEEQQGERHEQHPPEIQLRQ